MEKERLLLIVFVLMQNPYCSFAQILETFGDGTGKVNNRHT